MCFSAALAPSTPAAPNASPPSGFADPLFQHLTPSQGLPNGLVTCLAQDAQGFVWIGAMDGITRWDGYRAKVFRVASGSQGLPSSSFASALHFDRRGQLWAGTAFGGLLKLNTVKEQFEPWPAAGSPGISGRSVRAIADDGERGFWVATDGGLNHVDLTSERLTQASATGQWAAPAGPDVRALLRDREGRLWLASARGLFLRASPSAALEAVVLEGNARPKPTAVTQDSAGRIWVSTEGQGVFVLSWRDGRVSTIRVTAPTQLAGISVLDSATVPDMIEASPGEMWLATGDQGIVAVNLDGGWSRRIRHVPDSSASLLHNSARAFLRDRGGLVWVVTNLGISRHEPQRDALMQRFGVGSDEMRLNGSRTSAEVSWIQPIPGGGYWLGTHKNGIERLDANGHHEGQLLLDPARPASKAQDMVLGMAIASGTDVYVATSGGLFRAGKDGRKVQQIHLNGRAPAAGTWALQVDGEELWIGGTDDGLWRLDLKTGVSELVLLQAPGLSSPRVTLISGNRRDGLWVGTRNGLNRVDVSSGRVVQWSAHASNGDGLSGRFVSALLTDSRGRRWVGTYGGGIDILPAEGSDASPVRLTVEQGLPAATVDALIMDAQNAIWASVDGSLARIDPETLAVQAFGRRDSAILPTYWTGSATRGPQGEILFGGSGGLTAVHPQRLRRSGYLPQVLIADVQVGGRAVSSDALADRLQVPADANRLAVEVSSSAFATPERNRFSFKLDGFDDDWRETDATRRVAAYANLPPGDYTLRLRASNGDGLWSPTEQAIAVRVLPAWHQTWWFRAAAVLPLAGAFALAVGTRTRLLRARQRLLEQRVLERTAALEAAHRALEEKSRQLEQSSLTDPLTGLHNRRYLAEHIERDLAAGRRRAKDARAAGVEPMDTDTAFLLVDLDRFKQVNDGYGHAAGDAVLVELGSRLRAVLRESDYLVRWGGEEFLAVARQTDRLRVEELAERMRDAVARQPFLLPDGRLLSVTCSIGFACLSLAQESTEPAPWTYVVDLADKGLYAAKRSGRNAWVGVHCEASGHGAATMGTLDGHHVSSSGPLELAVAAYDAAAPVAAH